MRYHLARSCPFVPLFFCGTLNPLEYYGNGAVNSLLLYYHYYVSQR